MRDLRAPLICLVAALVLSGCMGRTSPVAGDTVFVGERWF
ncbi:hypothetical protein AB7M49_008418 [Bradyrhizobium elkanii]